MRVCTHGLAKCLRKGLAIQCELGTRDGVSVHTSGEELRPPFLLRLGIVLARAVAILGLLGVACHPMGGMNVRVNGEAIGPSQVLTRAYPAILLFAGSLLALAYGLKVGRAWARPGMAAFWVVLIALLLAVGGAAQVWNTLASTLPVAAFTLGYLYFSPAVQAYYSALVRRDGRRSDLQEWLDTPGRRERGA